MKIYRFWGDDTEAFFIKFWQVNALLLLFTIMILALKFNPASFAIFAFSPITLLAIERGECGDRALFARRYYSDVLCSPPAKPYGLQAKASAYAGS